MNKYLLIVFITILLWDSSSRLFAQSEENLSDIVFIEGNYLRNLGTFGSLWPDAKGAYIGYGLYFPDHNMLILKTGYFSHNYRGADQFDGSLNIVTFQIGGRYYFFNDKLMPFFQFMNGINVIFQNISLTGVQEDKAVARYSWQVGVGGTYSINDKINIDIGINYNSAFYDNDKTIYHEAGAMMTGFEYTIGMGWKIND